MDDKFKFQQKGLQWLYEMELTDDPQLVNNLKLNIFSQSRHIREVEILSLHEFDRKEMLIWLELSWFGRKFFTDHICTEVQVIVSKLLPNFKIRVTHDSSIFEMAKNNIKRFLEGRRNAISNSVNASDSSSKSGADGLQKTPDLLSDKKEPTEPK